MLNYSKKKSFFTKRFLSRQVFYVFFTVILLLCPLINSVADTSLVGSSDNKLTLVSLEKKWWEVESRREVFERQNKKSPLLSNSALIAEYRRIAEEAVLLAAKENESAAWLYAGRALSRLSKFLNEPIMRQKAINAYESFVFNGTNDLSSLRDLYDFADLELADLYVANGDFDRAHQKLTSLLLKSESESLIEEVQDRLVVIEEKRYRVPQKNKSSRDINKNLFESRLPSEQNADTGVISDTRFRIVIDPGHGGRDVGATGAGGLREKDTVVDIALLVKEELLRLGDYDVHLTRNNDNFISLNDRTRQANNRKADVFISLHCNASKNGNASGLETYYLDTTENPSTEAIAARENQSLAFDDVAPLGMDDDIRAMLGDLHLQGKVSESVELAEAVHGAIIGEGRQYYPSLVDLGVRKAPFVVLIGAQMPSILVELLFIDNPKDSNKLESTIFREALARGIAKGIVKYAQGQKSSLLADSQ
jgi:N-acetylmuramoyl-L-alanine amidase